jgi:hypothetical protein
MLLYFAGESVALFREIRVQLHIQRETKLRHGLT